MKIKINIRLVEIAVIAIIATVLGITIINYSLFQRQVRADLSTTAKILKDTRYFESVKIDTDKIDLSTDISELRVTWIGADGTVLYDNDASAESLKNHFDRPEIQAAFSNGVGESVRRSDTMNKNTFYYAMLLDNGTVLRVATDAESMWSVFISVAPVIGLIILIVLALCVVISNYLTKQLIRPVEMMAENLAESDYETPYRELEPFANMIRSQHADILSAAKARQDFTANVSHELKTPLTAISGYAELLEGNMVENEKKPHIYREIKKNSERLLALINDIIRLSELDRSERDKILEEVDLNEIVTECMEELSINAKQRCISLSFSGKKCIVRGNKDMLKELTENLVQNAIRYNNAGGYVKVSIEATDTKRLLVEDNGIGIPLADQQRVFERFYRVDKSRSKATGGTGLGLAIVKHIVELHNAKVELKSEEGRGTTMIVTF